jgi:hypothetical protein
MVLTLEIFALLTMIVLMFVLIWGLVALIHISRQLLYKNQLTEQLIELLKDKKATEVSEQDLTEET